MASFFNPYNPIYSPPGCCLSSPATNPLSSMPKKLTRGPAERTTHPLVWIASFLITIIAIAVIIAGTVVFVGYLVIHPRIPVVRVAGAHLDLLNNDLAGLLQTQVTIVLMAENDNQKAHATFSDMHFNLTLQGLTIATLVSDPVEVDRHDSVPLNYVVQSSMIPLNPAQMEETDLAWKRNEIRFDLRGSARARWRVGPLGSVKFWSHLDCQLKFHTFNGTYINEHCSSKSK